MRVCDEAAERRDVRILIEAASEVTFLEKSFSDGGFLYLQKYSGRLRFLYETRLTFRHARRFKWDASKNQWLSNSQKPGT